MNPDAMQKLHAAVVEGKSITVFTDTLKKELYTVEEKESDIVQDARAVDMTLHPASH